MTTLTKLKGMVALLAVAVAAVTAVAIRQYAVVENVRVKADRFDAHCRWTLMHLQTLRKHLGRPLLQRSAAQELRTRFEHEPNDLILCARSYSPPSLGDVCALEDFACYARIAGIAEGAVAAGLD